MNISDEAVEAAAASWLHDWDTTTDGMRMVIRERMRAALEAAAPYMLAGAWQDGAADGHLYGIKATNPYRSQA